MALHQFVPGKIRRLSRNCLFDRVGTERHRPRHIVERDLTALDAEQPELQGLDDTAQRRIAGQHLYQALRLGQHVHLRAEIGDRLEQQSLLRKEPSALGLIDRSKQILLLRQALHQRIAGGLHQFDGRRIDHGNDQFEMGKRFLHFGLALAPGNIR